MVCVEGRRLDFATGKQSLQRRYYLTSLSPQEWAWNNTTIIRIASIARLHEAWLLACQGLHNLYRNSFRKMLAEYSRSDSGAHPSGE
jgi:hypothetical protein